MRIQPPSSIRCLISKPFPGMTSLRKILFRWKNCPKSAGRTRLPGQVTAEASSETGIPEGTPVNFGAVDALSEAVSVGVVDTGELMIMYGSTAFFIFLIDKPVPSNELWLEAGAFKGQYEYSAGLSTSGSATTWFRDQFGKDLIYGRICRMAQMPMQSLLRKQQLPLSAPMA